MTFLPVAQSSTQKHADVSNLYSYVASNNYEIFGLRLLSNCWLFSVNDNIHTHYSGKECITKD